MILRYIRYFIIFLGRYVWSESLQVADYINWAPAEPNGDAGRFDCLFKCIRSADGINAWWDHDCSSTTAWSTFKTYALC